MKLKHEYDVLTKIFVHIQLPMFGAPIGITFLFCRKFYLERRSRPARRPQYARVFTIGEARCSNFPGHEVPSDASHLSVCSATAKYTFTFAKLRCVEIFGGIVNSVSLLPCLSPSFHYIMRIFEVVQA